MDQTTAPDLRAYLRSLDVDTLAELLAEQAARDSELHSRLTLRAGEAAETSRVGAVLDTVQRLLDAGSQADLTPLARRTVDRIVKAGDHAELRRAIGLCARACAVHPPAPAQLADWLCDLAFAGHHVELADFAEALGDHGLGRMKSTVDNWAKENEPVADRLSEQLAEISGDVDALLEILSRRPPTAEVSRKIMRVLRAAGRTTDAVAHAARALGPGRNGEFRRKPAEKETPDELATHKTDIDELIRKGPPHYEEAARRLRNLRTLCRKAGAPEEFTSYLTGLVTTHKRKTRLLAEIRNARIALPR